MALNSKNVSNKELDLISGINHILDGQSHWSGTMTELNSFLKRISKKSKRNQFNSAISTRYTLNKVLCKLRNSGVSVKFMRMHKGRIVRFSVSSLTGLKPNWVKTLNR